MWYCGVNPGPEQVGRIAWTKGGQFTSDPGGIDVVYDDRPVRHFRQRMQAVFEAT